MPQQLNFLDRPAPKAQLWERLNEEQRATVIDIIARVIGKAVRPAKDTTTDNQEKIHD